MLSACKNTKKNPALISKEIASEIELEDFAEIKNVGPYINFFLDRKKFENEVINTIIDKKKTSVDLTWAKTRL